MLFTVHTSSLSLIVSLIMMLQWNPAIAYPPIKHANFGFKKYFRSYLYICNNGNLGIKYSYSIFFKEWVKIILYTKIFIIANTWIIVKILLGTKISMLYWREFVKNGCTIAGFHCIILNSPLKYAVAGFNCISLLFYAKNGHICRSKISRDRRTDLRTDTTSYRNA